MYCTHTLPRKWNKYPYSQILGTLAVWRISHFLVSCLTQHRHTHFRNDMDVFCGETRQFHRQLHIHVISFSKLSGWTVWTLSCASFKYHLMQEQNTITSFIANKNIPATGQVLTPKGRPKITRSLHFQQQNPSQSCILNTHSSFIQPYSVIAPFSFWNQAKHNKRKCANLSAFIINGKVIWEQ
jgi:hypothetical protein